MLYVLYALALFCLEQVAGEALYEIRGQIVINGDPGWQSRTVISANFGEYLGYAQQNGSFVIPNIKPGKTSLETFRNFPIFAHKVL